MPYLRDPDGRQSAAIIDITDFRDKSVLEIGCGDGNLTWSYASRAARVTAIDPSSEDIESARQATPPDLVDRVDFVVSDIDDFSPGERKTPFDIALFTWSL
ncbi:MAG: class I SAM-dependent methyltransferase [Candidatus Promineifilaceae bacterium]